MKTYTPLIFTAALALAVPPAGLASDSHGAAEEVMGSLRAVKRAVTGPDHIAFGRPSDGWTNIKFRDLNGKTISVWAWNDHLAAKPGERVRLYDFKLLREGFFENVNPLLYFQSSISAYHGVTSEGGSLRIRLEGTALDTQASMETVRVPKATYVIAQPLAPLIAGTQYLVVHYPKTEETKTPTPSPFAHLKEVPAPDSRPADEYQLAAQDAPTPMGRIARNFLPLELELGGGAVLKGVGKQVVSNIEQGRPSAGREFAQAKRAGLLGQAGALYDIIRANQKSKPREFSKEESQLLLNIAGRAGLLSEFYGDLEKFNGLGRLDTFVDKWRTFLLSELLIYRDQAQAVAAAQESSLDIAAALEDQAGRVRDAIGGNERPSKDRVAAEHRVQAAPPAQKVDSKRIGRSLDEIMGAP